MLRTYRVTIPIAVLLITAGIAWGQTTGPRAEPATQPLRAITLQDILARTELHIRSPLTATPNGDLVAVTVHTSHEEPFPEDGYFSARGLSPENAGTHVAIVAPDSGEVRWPFGRDYTTTSFSPNFSPDGRRLAAYARKGNTHLGLAVWDRDSGKVTYFRNAETQRQTGFTIPRWTPDSTTVIFPHKEADPCRPELDEPPDERVMRNDPNGMLDHPLPESRGGSSLVALNVESGELSVIESFISPTLWRVSPDGTRVAYFRPAGRDERNWFFRFELTVAPIDDEGRFKKIEAVSRGHWGPSLGWSPDGNLLAYGVGETFYVVDVSEELSQRKLTLPEGHAADAYNAPIWSNDSRYIYAREESDVWRIPADGSRPEQIPLDLEVEQWAHHGKYYPVAQAAPGNRVWLEYADGLARVDLDTGEVVKSRSLDPKKLAGRARFITPDHRRAFIKSRRTVRMIDLAEGKLQTVFELPRRETNIRVANARHVPMEVGGVKGAGHLMLPPDFKEGEPVPMILVVYAGSRVGTLGLSVVPPELLATRGYGLLAPPLPLDPNRSPMEQIPDLVAEAADWAIEQEYADPNAIALMGQSYGGYTVLATVAADDRYRTAIISNGMLDLVHLASRGSYGYVEVGQGGMGDTIWANPSKYIANSPFFFLDRVETPLLLISGLADGTQDMMQATYRGLKRHKATVELRQYVGGGHGPDSWPASQRRRLLRAVSKWMDATMPAEVSTRR